jgi:hypothetical protein
VSGVNGNEKGDVPNWKSGGRRLPRVPFASTVAAHAATIAFLSEPGAKPGEEPAVQQGGGEQQVPPFGRNDKKLGGADSDVFRGFVAAGKRLAEIHVDYEQQPEYELTKVEKKGEKLDYRVTKMKLGKDKGTLIYNQFLTLSGMPKETYEYRLGNRSALEWVIDQYQVSTDKRSGITNDPNREDDREYILRLIGKVITVSLETVNIVKSLPDLGVSDASGGDSGS